MLQILRTVVKKVWWRAVLVESIVQYFHAQQSDFYDHFALQVQSRTMAKTLSFVTTDVSIPPGKST